MLLVSDHRNALSAAVGGSASTLGSALLVLRMFRFGPETPPARIVRAFYVGEGAKIALTVLILAFAVVRLDVNVLVMMLTYLATLPVYWFALLATARRHS